MVPSPGAISDTREYPANVAWTWPAPVAAWQGVQGVQCTPQKDLGGAPKELFKGARKFS